MDPGTRRGRSTTKPNPSITRPETTIDSLIDDLFLRSSTGALDVSRDTLHTSSTLSSLYHPLTGPRPRGHKAGLSYVLSYRPTNLFGVLSFLAVSFFGIIGEASAAHRLHVFLLGHWLFGDLQLGMHLCDSWDHVTLTFNATMSAFGDGVLRGYSCVDGVLVVNCLLRTGGRYHEDGRRTLVYSGSRENY